MSHGVPCLYQETRLSPSARSPATVLDINTSDQAQTSVFGAGRKRGADEISGLDEEAYARKHLATEGSLFFRRRTRTPRSFLWRVVDDARVVEVQSVDVAHRESDGERGEGWLTFRLVLPHAIMHNGVALADPDEHDSLDIFVLTTANDLYTFTLKRDILTRDSAPSDFDAKTCFRKYSSNTLAFRHAYRFLAESSHELLISLSDGGLLRLQRRSKDDQWRETLFTDGGWSGTLRGLIPLKRHQTIKYGNLELDPSSIAAMAKSPDGKHIWTISLDNELRAWSTETGKKVAEYDLLSDGHDEEKRKQQRYVMEAEQGTLLQIVTLPPAANDRSLAKAGADEKYFLVIYVPKNHQFVFYGMTISDAAAEGEGMQLDALHGGQTLVPPIDMLMNTNVWHLAEFHVQPGPNWNDTRMWLRARSGAQCQIFSMTFDFFNEQGAAVELDVPWTSGWTIVDPGMQTLDAIRGAVDYPGSLEDFAGGATTPSEKWLEFLFRPWRFSLTSIETALHIYRRGRNLPTSGAGKGLHAAASPLKDRLVQAVTSKTFLHRLSTGQSDIDRFNSDIQAQWRTFFSILAHLHSRRNETIGFAFDRIDELAWTVGADYVAPVRKNDFADNVALNTHIVSDDALRSLEEDVAMSVFPETESIAQSTLMGIAKEFRTRLSADLQERFSHLVALKALQHELGNTHDNKTQIQALYDETNMSAEVMNDDFEALQAAADVEAIGGLGNITADFLLGILDVVSRDYDRKVRDKYTLDPCGYRLMVAMAQETLERYRQNLLDVLVLIVFMHGDLERDELDSDFCDRIDELYDAIIFRIKNNELLSWLACHEIAESRSTRQSSHKVEADGKANGSVTLLERVAIGDFTPKSDGQESLPEKLSLWNKQWLFGADFFGSWDGITGYVLSVLLKKQVYDLATDFQKFITAEENSSSWIKYLQGRLLLATGDYALAGLKFHSAAADMAQADRIATVDTMSLLSEEERNHFGQGPTSFFQHVAALFERLKVWSYTADFAQIALHCLENGDDADKMYEQDRLRNDPDSSQVDIIDATMEQQRLLTKMGSVREDLLSRLFNALLQTGRFEEAFMALQQISALPVKRSELKKLLNACVKQEAIQVLLGLPFDAADLAQEADAVLLALAKQELATTTAGNRPFYQILYAFRTQRSDFRGAAELLHEHLERLRHRHHKHDVQDPEDETLIHAYVMLINTLACCGEDDAWLLVDPLKGVHGEGTKRRLVKIADVRREYAAELDKRSDILQGRFPLLVADGDEMDVL